MENKILNNLKMIYHAKSYGRSSGKIEVFLDIEGYNSLIK